jgi:histidyl-tRNA synthetase
MLKERNTKLKNKDKIDLYFVQLGDEAKQVVLPISLQAREAGINTVVSLGTPSMKEQMLKANRSGSKYVVMVGLMEARNGIFQVRDIDAGTQEEVKKEDIIQYIIEKIGSDRLDFYCPAKDLVTEEIAPVIESAG